MRLQSPGRVPAPGYHFARPVLFNRAYNTRVRRRIISRRLATIAAAPLAGMLLWLWARRLSDAYENRDVESSDVPGKRIEVERARLRVIDRGEGDAILLIHGLGASSFTWRKNIDALAQSFRVVSVDLLGFGYSQRVAPVDYSLAGHARRIILLMDILGIERAVIVGHSLGGTVAQILAARYPERVRRLVLINSSISWDVRALSLLRFLLVFEAFFYAFFYQQRPLRRLMFQNLYSPRHQLPDEVTNHYMELARIRGHRKALSRLVRDVAHDEFPHPEQLTLPVLILWGEDDRLLPGWRGSWLAGWMPDARLVRVPDAGHMTPEEQPELVNREIAAFALEMKTGAGREPA